MKESRESSARSQLIYPIAVFIAVLVFGYIYRDILRDTALVFFLYMFWVGELAFQSLGQRNIWILALVITLVLTVRFSRQMIENPIAQPKTTLDSPPPDTRRISFWRKRVKVMRSTAERDYYLSDLYQLIIKSLAYDKQINPEDIKEQLRSGTLLLPSEVYDFLGVFDLQYGSDQQIGFIQKLQQRFHRIRGSFKSKSNLPDPGLEKVAAYLESLLEDGDDI
jgi:hypothetical protein